MKRAAIGIIFNEDRTQILVIQRSDVPVWVLPGGGVEQEEQPEEAIVREVFEETGLRVRVHRKVAEYTSINRLAYPTFVFECQRIEGELSTGAETYDIGFYSIGALPSSFFFLHHEWLQDALKNEPAVIKKTIDSVTYFALFKFFLKHPILVLRFAMTCLGFPVNRKG